MTAAAEIVRNAGGRESVPDADTASRNEEDVLGTRDEDEGLTGIQKQRKSDFDGHIHWVKIALLWLVVGAYVASVFVWVIHLVASENLRWLDESDVSMLQNLLLSASIGAVANNFISGLVGDKSRRGGG